MDLIVQSVWILTMPNNPFPNRKTRRKQAKRMGYLKTDKVEWKGRFKASEAPQTQTKKPFPAE